MITHIESQVDNKDRIAIVIVGYNRLNSIKRVLSSVETAEFPDDYIPLILVLIAVEIKNCMIMCKITIGCMGKNM